MDGAESGVGELTAWHLVDAVLNWNTEPYELVVRPKTLGIELLDHIVVAREGAVSVRESMR